MAVVLLPGFLYTVRSGCKVLPVYKESFLVFFTSTTRLQEEILTDLINQARVIIQTDDYAKFKIDYILSTCMRAKAVFQNSILTVGFF